MNPILEAAHLAARKRSPMARRRQRIRVVVQGLAPAVGCQGWLEIAPDNQAIATLMEG